jgi:hypothetical protein
LKPDELEESFSLSSFGGEAWGEEATSHLGSRKGGL